MRDALESGAKRLKPCCPARIETARLVLRPLEIADAPFISRESSNPEIAQMTGAVPLPNPVLFAEGFILMRRAAEVGRGEAVRLVQRREDAAPLGVAGMRSHGGGVWELGCWFATDAWGAGYATEAGRAMLAPFIKAGARLVAGHPVDNPASRRVLEKLGFTPTGVVESVFALARGGRVDMRRMALS